MRLSHPPGDELRVLSSEVDHEDRVVVGRHLLTLPAPPSALDPHGAARGGGIRARTPRPGRPRLPRSARRRRGRPPHQPAGSRRDRPPEPAPCHELRNVPCCLGFPTGSVVQRPLDRLEQPGTEPPRGRRLVARPDPVVEPVHGNRDAARRPDPGRRRSSHRYFSSRWRTAPSSSASPSRSAPASPTFFLLREVGMSRPVATVGAALFALNGTFSWLNAGTMNPVPPTDAPPRRRADLPASEAERGMGHHRPGTRPVDLWRVSRNRLHGRPPRPGLGAAAAGPVGQGGSTAFRPAARGSVEGPASSWRFRSGFRSRSSSFTPIWQIMRSPSAATTSARSTCRRSGCRICTARSPRTSARTRSPRSTGHPSEGS